MSGTKGTHELKTVQLSSSFDSFFIRYTEQQTNESISIYWMYFYSMHQPVCWGLDSWGWMWSNSQGGKMVMDTCDFSSMINAMVIKVGAGCRGGPIYTVLWCPPPRPPSYLPCLLSQMSQLTEYQAVWERQLEQKEHFFCAVNLSYFLSDLKRRAEFIILHRMDSARPHSFYYFSFSISSPVPSPHSP